MTGVFDRALEFAMKEHGRMRPALMGWLIIIALAASGEAQQPIKPSSPSVVAPPTWSRVLNMPDGRTFVSDGGISVDVTLAKPTTLPSVVIPPESSKILASLMTAPYDKEIGLAELQPGSFKNSFMTSDGIFLNGNYVNFLRQVVPLGRTRLRTKGKRDPVVVVIDGQLVGIMMPLAPPTP